MLSIKDKEYDERKLSSDWHIKFKEAMIHKAPYTKRWLTYMDAYKGDYFKNKNMPEYKSNVVSNYIFSTIETIRPIMLDNDPVFQSTPRQPEGMEFSNDCNEALMYEWDREQMRTKLYRELINVLVIGNAIFFIPWNAQKKEVQGIPVNPFCIFVDPLATCFEDAEYVIYAKYMNVVLLRRMFKEKADKLHGSQINYSELVSGNDKNSNLKNQVLVLDIWTKDYEVEEKIDGNEKITKSKYPNGRHIILCPEIGVVLSDTASPYEDGHPFVIFKDYDVPGVFWGEGEVAQLLSPQTYLNEINNCIVDTAKATANMPWIVDKNAGIPFGKITARPGLIIRKNPGSEVRREPAPQMPMYITSQPEVIKGDIHHISGIYESLRGDGVTGVYTAQGILALQEAGQVRIRLKVKLMEESLAKVGQKWYRRMKKYWKEDKWLLITKADGSYDMKKFVASTLNYDYDIKITAGSTMPVNRSAMLDLMIRLAQTPMPDGMPIVDREAVAQYLPEEVKSSMLRRMKGQNQNLAQLQQAVQQMGQQMQQFMQQSEQRDNEQMNLIQELMTAVEGLNKQIIQLQDKHDKIESERIQMEKENKLRDESYNKGFTDAEKMYSESEPMSIEEMEGVANEQLPEEILSGIENMSDEELSLLMMENPELQELFR